MDGIDLEALKKSMNSGGLKEERKDFSSRGYDRKTNRKSNSSYKNNSSHHNNGNKGSQADSYVGAPYNFVPFTKKAYDIGSNLIAHNDMEPGLLSGEIAIKVRSMSPILISDGRDRFYRDAYNRYAIPGSSFRGLIRNNVQILSASSVCEDIEDYSLMYRDVVSGLNNNRYEAILGKNTVNIDGKSRPVLENVKAGFLVKKGRNFFIRQPEEDVIMQTGKTNYFIVYKKKVVSRELDVRFDFGCTIKKISYVNKGRIVTAVDLPGKFPKQGWLVDSGHMSKKYAFYVIPEEKKSDGEDILVDSKDIDCFRIDFEKKKNTLGRNSSFFALPNNGEIKPVFYVRDGGRTYFGYTPYIRLFYEHTIADGIPSSMKNVSMDYARSMFGYSTREKSYKSRLSFGDLRALGEDHKEKEYEVVLGEPKASAYMNYLVQRGDKGSTYNDDQFELRGIKQYWLYNSEDGMKTSSCNSVNEKVISVLRALPEGTDFAGKVRFHNLRKEELGLLLWAISLEKDSWMNIGKGKPYGLGSIKVSVDNVSIINETKAYSLDSFELAPFELIDPVEFIEYYKKHLLEIMGIDWTKDPSIKTLLLMKDSMRIPHNKDTSYMSLQDYKNQKKGYISTALKEAEAIIKK